MFAPVHPFTGMQPIDMYVPTTTQQHPLGMMIDAVDMAGFYGGGSFVYGKAAAAITAGRLSFMTSAWVATDIPNTANTGFPVFVNPVNMAINTYGWFQSCGLMPIQTANSVAIGVAAGIAAAGQAGTVANGKQLLGARVVQPSTYALTKTITIKTGSYEIVCPNTSGLIQGLAVTGTGVGSSAIITAIDPSGTKLTVDVASTANSTLTGTFTFTGFLLIQGHPFVQGQVA